LDPCFFFFQKFFTLLFIHNRIEISKEGRKEVKNYRVGKVEKEKELIRIEKWER